MGNSGPGGPAWYACVPCACVYARSPLSPEWLSEEIARTEARQASGRGDPPSPLRPRICATEVPDTPTGSDRHAG